MHPSLLLDLLSDSAFLSALCRMARLEESILSFGGLLGGRTCPFAYGDLPPKELCPPTCDGFGVLKVSEVKPARRMRLAGCLLITESSDALRGRLRGLRPATSAVTASGDNMIGPAA